MYLKLPLSLSLSLQLCTMHLISAGGLHGKGFGGHADSVFNEKQGRTHGNKLLYARP